MPLGNGILTVDTEAQAWSRARAPTSGDKGGDAARAALAMVRAQTPTARTSAWQTAAPTPDKDARKANRRGAARLAAVQALYQMDIAGTGVTRSSPSSKATGSAARSRATQYLPAEAAFFRDIVSGVVRDQRKLDPLIDEALAKGWPLKRIEAILRAVLRAGAYELEHRTDVPARVVVSEYADVAARLRRARRDRHGQCGARPARAQVARGRVLCRIAPLARRHEHGTVRPWRRRRTRRARTA